MIFDVLILIVLFLVVYYAAFPEPIKIVNYVLLALALLVLILPFVGLHVPYPR